MIFASNTECQVGLPQCANCSGSGLQAWDFLPRSRKKSRLILVSLRTAPTAEKREMPSIDIISQYGQCLLLLLYYDRLDYTRR